METVTRESYQGVWNIIRFNWHFYAMAGLGVIAAGTVGIFLSGFLFWLSYFLTIGILTSTVISLLVSHYIYDRSGLYDFNWLQQLNGANIRNIVNVNAGFDETSEILKRNFSQATLQVFDFYDPDKHTEVSIERARMAYPAFTGTIRITTRNLMLPPASIDIIFNIFALHEVRDRDERIQFLRAQSIVLENHGKIVLVEHLRDVQNFLAYTIGFFHFFSEAEWKTDFHEAGLTIDQKLNITPFVNVFILKKTNGDPC